MSPLQKYSFQYKVGSNKIYSRNLHPNHRNLLTFEQLVVWLVSLGSKCSEASGWKPDNNHCNTIKSQKPSRQKVLF